MILKPAIIIASLGRTGTLFFAQFFADILPKATVLHEPDFLNFGQYQGWREKVNQVQRQLRESGFMNLIVRKALGQWNLIRLSHARARKELSDASAIEKALRQRRQFVSSRDGSTYVESSTACYGLIDIFPHVYHQHRLIYLVRDGRDWVRSKMNFGTMYAKGPIRQMLTIPWPTAPELPNDPYAARWPTMSRFERICWAWTTLNRYAVTTLKANPQAQLFYFENIFKGPDREKHLEEMVLSATKHLSSSCQYSKSAVLRLNHPVHQSHKRFPKWKAWTSTQREQFNAICGPLMEELGYF